MFELTPLGDWTTQARCAGLDTDIFFPFSQGRYAALSEEVLAAKAICRGCPVRTQCAEYGASEAHGIFGGLTPEERRRLNPRRPSSADRVGTARRLRALACMGYSSRQIAQDLQRLGLRVSASLVQKIGTEEKRNVTTGFTDAVTLVYEQCASRFSGGPQADYVSRRAHASKWMPPGAWVRRDIDDPDEPDTAVVFGGPVEAGVA